MIQILPNLRLGNLLDARREATMNGSPIDVVIYLGQELHRDLSHESLIPVVHVPLRDGSGNGAFTIRFIIGMLSELLFSRKTTLVACRQAISRSPTIVAGYLATFESKQYTFQSAFQSIRKQTAIMPNPSLVQTVERVVNRFWENGHEDD